MFGKILKLSIFISVAILCLPNLAIASAEVGTIDPGFRYAWSNNIGTVSFYTDQGNVTITDSGLSGYAWSSGYGWINLNPTNGGVANDGAGNLSGYAWGENLGWINFSGVSINSSGKFTGQATGDIIGILTFNCAQCNVRTDWRSVSNRTGGSSLPAESSLPPAPPSFGQELKIIINNGDKETDSRKVVLSFIVGSDTDKMAISNSLDFSKINLEDYASQKEWLLEPDDGEKIVYVKFYTKWGVASGVIFAKIILKEVKDSVGVDEDGEHVSFEQISDSGESLKEVMLNEKKLVVKINSALVKRLAGRILLQVEENGRAWYLEPISQERYFLGRPRDAFDIMRRFGLGISENNFNKFKKEGVPKKFAGRIFLRVEENGEAYYINPVDMKMYYLGRPHDAFVIMRELALGISNQNIRQIGVADAD